MDTILSKKQMTEEDIKLRFITPAITAKWDTDHITMETRITDGRINLKGNMVVREKPKKADYVLYSSTNMPIAIVEANSDNPFKNKREHIEQFLSSYADVYIGADQEDKILPRAKEIMDTGIKAKDAIHAACAIEAGCDYLITTDKRFSGLRSSEIKVINPVDFVRLEEGK